MENVKLDNKVKQALDLFDLRKIEIRTEPSNTYDSCNGLLHQIGFDYESLLLDIITAERPKEHEKKTVSSLPRSEGCRPQPRFSSLTYMQHIYYLQHRDPFRLGRHTAGRIKVLHHKILQEQQEFEDYAFQIAVDRIASYNLVLPEAEKIFKQIISRDLKRMQEYVQAYVYHQSFLIAVVPYTKDPQPKYENLCAKLGTVPIIRVPEPDESIPIYHPSSIKPTSTSVAKDNNAEKLAKSFNADVVITMSALRTLVNNTAPFSEEWEMPMTIKQVKDSEGKVKNVLFIDKALPPKSVNAREKMSRYFKKAIKQFLLNGPASKTIEATRIENERTNRRAVHESENERIHSSQDSECDTDNSDTSSESDDSIPQLDGVDDKIKEKNKKSSPSSRIKRKSSVPTSLAQPAALNLWKDSFKKLEKPTIRSKSTSGTASFEMWASKKIEKNEKPDKPKASLSADSETELVIDTGSENEGTIESTDAPLSEEKDEALREEQQEISFKASIPSNILGGFALNEEQDAENSPEETPASPPSDSSICLRHSTLSVSPKQSSSASVRRSARNRSESNSEPKITSPSRRSARQKNRSKMKKSKTCENDSSDASLPSAVVARGKASRKRSKKSDDTSVGESVSKRSKPEQQIADDKTEKTRKTRSISEVKAVKSSSVRSGKKPNSKQVSSSSDDDMPLSQISKHVSDKKLASPKSSKILLLSEVKVKSLPNPPSGEKTADKSQPISSNVEDGRPTSSENSDHQKSKDILGQILDMQKTRKDTMPEKINLKKSVHSEQFKTIVPSLPVPDDNYDFDTMLKLHGTTLAETGKSLFYSLWSIGSFRVLIRGGLHGQFRQKKNNASNYVSIHTKLEYLPDLGYERMKKSEACAEWLDLQFRPQSSTVLRCHVDPFARKILSCERVENEESTYLDFKEAGFSHLQANKLLLSAFQKLTMQHFYDKGSYLICHKHGANEFVIRRESRSPSSKTVIYDLNREYASPGRMVLCTPQTISWVPLDPWKQNRWQQQNRRVPMTFDLKPTTAEAKKKKKGKKKKKKQCEGT